MSYDEYDAIDAVRASDLVAIGKSPLHYQWSRTHHKSTASTELGSAAHTAILEPHLYAREYAVYRDGKRDARTKAYQDFLAANAGKTILTPDEDEDARAMAAAVRRHPIANELLSNGVAERVLLHRDVATGLQVKIRPDWLRRKPGAIVDLKSTRDLTPRRFKSQAWDLEYHVKLALYHSVVLAVLGVNLPVWIVAVQSTDEHDVGAFECPYEWLQDGRAVARERLAMMARCRETNEWPGMCPEPVQMERPRWANASAQAEETEE
jgi:hypothetical protein